MDSFSLRRVRVAELTLCQSALACAAGMDSFSLRRVRVAELTLCQSAAIEALLRRY
jgi:hypothetical protein